jgi:hypothetical protein
MKVIIMGQMLIGRGNDRKHYNSKREHNGMPIGRTKILLARSRIAQYVAKLETFRFSLKSFHFIV